MTHSKFVCFRLLIFIVLLYKKILSRGWSTFVSANKIVREGYLSSDILTISAAITVEETSQKMDPSEVDVYLSYASESGCEESVTTCLAQGACVNSESEDKFTPLHYACNTTKVERMFLFFWLLTFVLRVV